MLKSSRGDVLRFMNWQLKCQKCNFISSSRLRTNNNRYDYIYSSLSFSLSPCSSQSSGLHPEQSTFLQVWIWIWIKIRLDGTNFQFAILFATGVAQRIMLLTFVINIVTSVLVDVLWHAATSTTETDWAKNAGVRWMTKKWEYRCRSTVLIYLCSNATNDNKPTNFIFAFWSDFTHFPAPTQSNRWENSVILNWGIFIFLNCAASLLNRASTRSLTITSPFRLPFVRFYKLYYCPKTMIVIRARQKYTSPTKS